MRTQKSRRTAPGGASSERLRLGSSHKKRGIALRTSHRRPGGWTAPSKDDFDGPRTVRGRRKKKR